jgi:hypothetical protein
MRRPRKSGESGGMLKVRVFLVCLSCLFGSTNVGWAVSKWFYEDGVIQEGEVYSYVGVYNDAIVDMTGGNITDQLTARNTSTVNISGGFVFALVGLDESRINIIGSVQGDILGLQGSANVNMSGGTFDIFEAYNSATGILRGGTISDYVLAYGADDLLISVYGYNLAYNPDAGSHGGGQVTGLWGDGAPFSIDLYAVYNPPYGGTIDTWSHVVLHTIPEPSTLILLTFAVVFMRSHR